MKRLIAVVALLAASMLQAKPAGFMEGFFRTNGLEGTVVLRSLKTGKEHVYNSKRATERFCPASTFKITNTLIALQEKAIDGVDGMFTWDGAERPVPAWNRDMDLEDAFQSSCVWCYQELARKLGRATYARYLKEMGYGNASPGNDVANFWLDGSLRISAREQIDVLMRIHAKSYRFDRAHYETLERIMRVESAENYTIRGKTGWATGAKPQTGWFVGWIETDDDTWFFAINMDIRTPEDARFRRQALDAAMRVIGLID
ncbi:MAG: class D beta-lactamase [Spirochaetes bacterium]|nr:class D beta-lactamase [Spirochaetota bacterium]